MSEFQFSTVEEALEDLKNGKIILVADDEDRENEGDMICAAEFATTENVNFMATHAKGLICMPMSEEICRLCGNNDRHFRKGTRTDGTKMCGRRCKTAGFQKTGTYVSADGKEKRRVRAQRTHRSDGGFDEAGRIKAVRSVL